MGKIFNPEKYNMIFCPLCEGKGKLLMKPSGFNVCKECGGFGLIKKRFGQNLNTLPILMKMAKETPHEGGEHL